MKFFYVSDRYGCILLYDFVSFVNDNALIIQDCVIWNYFSH